MREPDARMKSGMARVLVSMLCYLCLFTQATAQRAVPVTPDLDQHIFTFGEIEYLEDSQGSLDFNQVSSPAGNTLFKQNRLSTPQNTNLNHYYWYRIRIRHDSTVSKSFILEFFDQTIDDITAYLPGAQGQYDIVQLGDNHAFDQRLYRHKNFELPVNNTRNGEDVYYFRIRSSQQADIIIVLRSVNRFIGYALDEYFTFGIFYGMILIFSFYNLIMFIAVRQRQYLYYVLYIISVGLYEMCTDGIAYQYLWPRASQWNQYAFAFPLVCISVFTLLFARNLLHVKAKLPALNKLISAVIVARIAFFVLGWLFFRPWLNYKFIEIVPLALSFFTGVYMLRIGYRPARFFVLGYSFLFVGFMLKFFIMLGYSWLNFGVISYYSLSFCFIMEMFFLSFAIGDKVRLLKKKRERARQDMMRQMTVNARLKDNLNRKLEYQVQERTKELVEKNTLIEQQNEELGQVNDLLLEQAEQISRMNALLQQDNTQLRTNVEKVSKARALSAPVDFEEFSKSYPDSDSCFRFLADLKWAEGYTCRKCGNAQHFPGHQPFSRRCSKCGYEESVLANTLFQNSRIPINKAFYMVFLIYTSKGKISSHKLSEILGIRQSTCWAYLNRVRTLMDERKKELRQADEHGWSRLVC
jgi:hypothetical protein